MKKLLSPLLILFVLLMASCHNYVKETSDNQAKLSADSARRADSISLANKKDSADRAIFLLAITYQIDSMQSRMASEDSLYNKKGEQERAKWMANRKHISTRIEGLRDKNKQAGTMAKEKWTAFKSEIDTAVRNIKYEWKNGE